MYHKAVALALENQEKNAREFREYIEKFNANVRLLERKNIQIEAMLFQLEKALETADTLVRWQPIQQIIRNFNALQTELKQYHSISDNLNNLVNLDNTLNTCNAFSRANKNGLSGQNLNQIETLESQRKSLQWENTSFSQRSKVLHSHINHLQNAYARQKREAINTRFFGDKQRLGVFASSIETVTPKSFFSLENITNKLFFWRRSALKDKKEKQEFIQKLRKNMQAYVDDPKEIHLIDNMIKHHKGLSFFQNGKDSSFTQSINQLEVSLFLDRS
jgi:hypothetical protein